MSILAYDSPSARQNTSIGSSSKLSEQEQLNAHLKTALDQASEGIMILQPVFEALGPKIILSNARMSAMVGAEPKQGLSGRFITQLVASKEEADDLITALRRAAKHGGAAWEGSLKTLFGNGIQVCEWRIRAVQDEHGVLENFTLSVSPLTKVQEVSISPMAMPEIDDERRMRNDNLATLSLGVLHDLNNLLGIMMTNLSVAERLSPKEAEIGAYISEALAAAQQARKFTAQTMRMAKDLPVHHEAADLVDLIRETSRVAQSGSGVQLHMHLPKDLWWSVVDTAKITQVLQNLIINGIQAMDNTGHMDVLARNVIVPQGHALLPAGPHVEILVRDRGNGMSPEVLERVMKGSFTTKAEGNGIGLTTCRRIVEEHKGKIHLSSMKDIGTEVTLWLPATKPQEVTATPVATSKTLMHGVGSVLVVDDESRLRQVITAVLKQCGYRVYEASTGEEAITTYRSLMRQEGEVDLVIMDLTLKGGLSGEDALHAIKSLNPAAKVVASSGSLVDESLKGCLEQGFCDVLPKPYLAPDISALVHRHLMSRDSKSKAA